MLYVYLLVFTFNFAYLTNAMSNTDSVMNWLEYLNELSLIGMLYTMLFFVRTNQLESIIVWDAGVGTIAILALCFLSNLSYVVFSSISKSIYMGKLKLIRRKRIRELRFKKLNQCIKYEPRKSKKAAASQSKKSKKVLNNWHVAENIQKSCEQPTKRKLVEKEDESINETLNRQDQAA